MPKKSKRLLPVVRRGLQEPDILCESPSFWAKPDEVVHPKSSLPLIELVGSSDARNFVFPTGHIGAAVSAAAQKKLWPQVGAWLKERDGKRAH